MSPLYVVISPTRWLSNCLVLSQQQKSSVLNHSIVRRVATVVLFENAASLIQTMMNTDVGGMTNNQRRTTDTGIRERSSNQYMKFRMESWVNVALVGSAEGCRFEVESGRKVIGYLSSKGDSLSQHETSGLNTLAVASLLLRADWNERGVRTSNILC